MRVWRWKRIRLVVGVGLGLVWALAVAAGARPARAAATLIVTSLADAVDTAPGDGTCATALAGSPAPCTLRAAIQEANATAGDDLINFDPAVFTASDHTITLTVAGAGENAAASGDLDLMSGGGALTITNNGGQVITVDGAQLERVFEVRLGASVVLEDLRITNGQAGDYGGGVLSAGTTVVLRRVALVGNRATVSGGGLYVANGRTTVAQSLLADNQAVSGGGGVILSNGIGEFTNVTVANNTATTRGGGLITEGQFALYNVTVSGNSAADVSGIAGAVEAANSILAGNASGTDCTLVYSLGYNAIGSQTGCTVDTPSNDSVGQGNPLGAFNGRYFPIDRTSLAVDAGNPAGCKDSANAVLTVDQIGGTRPLDGNGDGVARCDQGAYEAAAVAVVIPPTVTSPAPSATATPTLTPLPAATDVPPADNSGPAPAATDTPTPPPSPTAAVSSVYVVQPGDNLFRLALRFETTIAVLQNLNGLTGDWIYVGQTLRLPGVPAPAPTATPPATAAGLYLVQPGDTLFRLALRYGTTVADLQALNGLGGGVQIYAGQTLRVPGLAGLAPAASPTPLGTQPAPVPPPTVGSGQHVVLPGETLFQLAIRYQTTVAALQAANGLGTRTLIYAGQILTVPTAAAPLPTPVNGPARVYLVQAGDTLFRLALNFDTTVTALQTLNGLPGTLIYAGQRLFLP